MGKHDKTGRSKNPDGQHVQLHYYLLRSDAWRGLSGNSVRVYLELYMRFNGTNNGKLFIGMDRIASNLGMSKSTVCKAFKELEEKGWIAKVKNGKWIRGQASEWRLTTKSMKNIPATNEWKQWRKPVDAIKKRKTYGSTKEKHLEYISAKNEFVGTIIEPI